MIIYDKYVQTQYDSVKIGQLYFYLFSNNELLIPYIKGMRFAIGITLKIIRLLLEYGNISSEISQSIQVSSNAMTKNIGLTANTKF